MAILLIVEDDIATNEAICEYMGAAGHTVLSAFDGEQGLAMAKSNRVDLVILDIMLPKVTGIDVLKELRKDSSLPVLMLTALDDEGTLLGSGEINHSGSGENRQFWSNENHQSGVASPQVVLFTRPAAGQPVSQ